MERTTKKSQSIFVIAPSKALITVCFVSVGRVNDPVAGLGRLLGLVAVYPCHAAARKLLVAYYADIFHIEPLTHIGLRSR